MPGLDCKSKVWMGSEDLPPQLEKQSRVHIRTLPSLACLVHVIILFA